MSRLGAVLVLALVTSASASAQPTRPTWFGGGAGVSAVVGDGEPGVSFLSAGLAYVRPVGPRPWVVRLGATMDGEILSIGPPEGMREVHTAIGASGRVGPLVGALVAGPSLAWVEWSEFEGRTFTGGARWMPGLYGSAQALLAYRVVAIGVEGSVHANAELPVAGIRLVVAGGDFR